jgi:integrase
MSALNPVYSYKTIKGIYFGVDFRCRGYRIRQKGFISKSEAELVVGYVRAEILTGRFNPSDYKQKKRRSEITLEELWLDFLKNNKKVKDSTKGNYLSMMRKHILPKFGSRKVETLTSNELNRFLSKFLKKYSSGYGQIIYTSLMSLFKWASDLELITEIPKMKKPVLKGQREKVFLKMDECKRMLQHAYNNPEDYWIESTLAIHFLILTGIRIGELRGLRYEDCDLEKGFIRIQRRVYNGVTDTPKNNKRQRIPLHPELIEVIQRAKELSEQYKENKNSDSKELFLTRRSGKVVSKFYLTKKIKELGKEVLGIEEGLSPHAFRRTLSQHLLEEGLSIHQVAGMLRNNAVVMLKHYSQSGIDALQVRFNELNLTGSVEPNLTTGLTENGQGSSNLETQDSMIVETHSVSEDGALLFPHKT